MEVLLETGLSKTFGASQQVSCACDSERMLSTTFDKPQHVWTISLVRCFPWVAYLLVWKVLSGGVGKRCIGNEVMSIFCTHSIVCGSIHDNAERCLAHSRKELSSPPT